MQNEMDEVYVVQLLRECKFTWIAYQLKSNQTN